MDVFTARPEAPESRSMQLPGTQLLSVSSTGEMAVLLNSRAMGTWVTVGTLARAPLIGGAPREIVENVQGPIGDRTVIPSRWYAMLAAETGSSIPWARFCTKPADGSGIHAFRQMER
jgi:hypothetical protein